MEPLRRIPPRTGGLLIIAVAVLFIGLELNDVLGGWVAVGIDYLPLRNAAQALLAGQSVFTDPLFVYPPTAAVLLLPTALGSLTAGFVAWVLAGLAALLLAAGIVARQAPTSRRPAIFGIAVMGLLGGVIANRSLFLGNLSELLVPVAVGALLACRRGRWVLGCALLAASLLVKPLLAPLVLVPALHRQWGPLVRTMLPGGALLLLAVGLVPGGKAFPSVLRYCLTGTNLHGDNAVNNLSLRGWAEGRHAPYAVGVAAAVVTLVAVVLVVYREMRAGGRPSPIWLGAVLLFGTFLAGGISEVHFLLIGYAVVLLHVVVDRPPVRPFVPGLALLAAPAGYLTLLLGRTADGQSWLVLAELLVLGALLVRRPAPAFALAPA
ncbi:glycosyltransferase family 87 protein [Actinoplanes subtropicus]|uniref:glycosyltransferase family 87 protein n=1 Tax=Actinoplanes subtropicus TaxID=543632 RepID=UPI0004C3BA67|nr:glycosyltransferase family 87 protein [Actinoplanes subtropicus]